MKVINAPSDLAIHGGPPAFREPLHVGRPNAFDREAFLRRAGGILDSRRFTNNGPVVQELEARLARHLDVPHCVVMCNGTVALEAAVHALGVRGEVIVPSFTFVATAHALQWHGITPVFCDIDPATHNIDPERVEELITPRTSAILGVHVWGRPCEITALQSIADRRGLKLLFDAAHAFDCSCGSRLIGGFGDCEVFSFHATKFFHTFEGGAVTTRDVALAAKLRSVRNFGFRAFDEVSALGINAKMSEMCAAMGVTALDGLGEALAVNKRNFASYADLFSTIPGLRLVMYPDRDRATFHYVIAELTPEFLTARDDLVRILHAENVLVRRYFHPGCHAMEPYRTLYPEAAARLPHTEMVSRRVVSFPTGTSIHEHDIAQIAEIVHYLATCPTTITPA